MHELNDGTWTINTLPRNSRPSALPDEWGAHFLAEDLAKRCGRDELGSEAVYSLAITAFQFAMTIGEPPEKFFERSPFCPWPEINLLAAPHEEPQWQRFDVAGYVEFMRIYEGGLPPDRVAELLGQLDLLSDYLVACGEIDAAQRERIVDDAQEAIDVLRAEAAMRRPRRRRRRR